VGFSRVEHTIVPLGLPTSMPVQSLLRSHPLWSIRLPVSSSRRVYIISRPSVLRSSRSSHCSVFAVVIMPSIPPFGIMARSCIVVLRCVLRGSYGFRRSSCDLDR